MKVVRQYNLGTNWHDVPDGGEIPISDDTIKQWYNKSWQSSLRGVKIKLRDVAAFEKGDVFTTPHDTLTYVIRDPEIITGKKDGEDVEYVACIVTNNKTKEVWPQHARVSNLLRYTYKGENA